MTKTDRQARQTEMFSRIEECLQSGMSKKNFCDQHSIPPSVFYYWQKKYNGGHLEGGCGFVPLSIQETAAPAIEVHYPNGVSIRVQGSVEISLLRMLVQLLG